MKKFKKNDVIALEIIYPEGVEYHLLRVKKDITEKQLKNYIKKAIKKDTLLDELENSDIIERFELELVSIQYNE